ERRSFIDERSARGVDQPAVLAKAGESFAVEPVQVVAARRQVETHEVRIPRRGSEIVRHRAEVWQGGRWRRIGPRTPDDDHAVAAVCDARDLAPDAAAADDRERFAL